MPFHTGLLTLLLTSCESHGNNTAAGLRVSAGSRQGRGHIGSSCMRSNLHTYTSKL